MPTFHLYILLFFYLINAYCHLSSRIIFRLANANDVLYIDVKGMEEEKMAAGNKIIRKPKISLCKMNIC